MQQTLFYDLDSTSLANRIKYLKKEKEKNFIDLDLDSL